MRDSVEGCQNATTFGLPSCIKKRRMVSQEKENCRSLETTLDAILESPSKSPVHCRQTDTDTQGSSSRPSKKQKVKMTPEFLEEELTVQKDICIKIGKAVDLLENHHQESSQCMKKIYRSIDRLHDQQKLVLQETKRHNIQLEQQDREKHEEMLCHNKRMENWRIREIEIKVKYKQDLIKIQQEKLQKM